jgi:hypothetical protein
MASNATTAIPLQRPNQIPEADDSLVDNLKGPRGAGIGSSDRFAPTLNYEFRARARHFYS